MLPFDKRQASFSFEMKQEKAAKIYSFVVVSLFFFKKKNKNKKKKRDKYVKR